MADGTLLVQVPVDDGAIQSAFDLLDAQMDAWLQAMQRAQRAVAARASLRSDGPTSSCEPTLEEAAQETAPVSASEPVIQAVQAADVLDTSAAATQVEELAPEMAVVEPTRPAAAVTPIRQGITPAQEIPPVEDTPPTAASPALNKHAEDESLLASLDEETAKAIRVMRRMCMNTKSVKELLAEYQAKKSNESVSAATAKKSWFRRK